MNDDMFRSYLKPFGFKKRQSWSIFVLTIALGSWYGYLYRTTGEVEDYLWSVVDPVAGIMTFITTLVIFYLQARQQWLDSLEKRLDVDYVYQGVLIGEIRGAYLSGESDIRAWSQSLGAQLFAQRFLFFDFVIEESNEVVFTAEKSFINQYSAIIYLTKDPRIKPTIKLTSTDKIADDGEDVREPTKEAIPALAKSHIERAEVYRWTRKK